MRRCQDVAESATEYLEGALPWWRALLLRLHLAICAACAAFLAQLAATREFLGLVEVADASPAEPPEDLVARLRARRDAPP
jgi:predicted anti-sigma-YlaC factor YlaD